LALLVHTTGGDLQLVPFPLSQQTPVAKVVQACPTGVAVGVGVPVAVVVPVGVGVHGEPPQTPTAGSHD
jgi:hypothetical protein